MFVKSIIGALAVVVLVGPWNGVARADADDASASSKLIIKPAVLTTNDQASTPVTEVQWRRGYRSYYQPYYSRGWSYGYPYGYSYYRPYYRSNYRPYYGSYYSYYRPYYRGYYAPYYTGYRGFSYYGPRFSGSFYW